MNIGRIANRQGEPLDYTLHPGAADATDVVVIGHGVTGSKDRPFHIALADAFAASGIPAVRVSWSGNGKSGGRFADSNITKEVADLRSILEALEGRRVTYAGHSMGAVVGLACASEDRRIRRLISLAGMVHVAAFAEREFRGWVPGRDIMWEKPECVLPQGLVDDMNRMGSLADRAAQVRVPWLFVHGDNDELVPLQDSRDAFARATGPKRLVVLEGADHGWEPGFIPRMVESVMEWCARTPPTGRILRRIGGRGTRACHLQSVGCVHGARERRRLRARAPRYSPIASLPIVDRLTWHANAPPTFRRTDSTAFADPNGRPRRARARSCTRPPVRP
jgi:pimeloyl-ACP methyl ester carboxylesterase